MKKVLVILMVTAFVVGMTGLALAVDPTEDTPFTFTESGAAPIPSRSVGPMDNTAVGVYGNSAWNYNDMWDTNYPYGTDTAKFEGSYKRFDSTSTGSEYTGGGGNAETSPGYGAGGDLRGVEANTALDTGVGLYASGSGLGPHGAYDTSTNKCKVCHAVHRANGAFRLMRVDNPEDACDYCHIGTHRHSLRGAYFRGDGTKHPTNGHTIGAKKTIPDSSVWQWLEEKSLVAGNGDEAEGDIAYINVRRYDSARNKIFKWFNRHGWKRVGPTYLYCMSCHQVHNANQLIWKPDGTNGYKLLRNTPSGSTSSSVAMRGYSAYSAGSSDDRVKVVEQTLSASTTGGATDAAGNGQPLTIYTKWKGDTTTFSNAANGMVVWCADCHNLNIGSKEVIASNFAVSYGRGGAYSHSDRTHPVPMKSRGSVDGYKSNSGCASCHPGDMRPPVVAKSTYPCYSTGCHITGESYNELSFYSDWPHAAASTSTKLLGDDYDASYEHIDMICMRCHTDIGETM